MTNRARVLTAMLWLVLRWLMSHCFPISCIVRAYHVYKQVWKPDIGRRVCLSYRRRQKTENRLLKLEGLPRILELCKIWIFRSIDRQNQAALPKLDSLIFRGSTVHMYICMYVHTSKRLVLPSVTQHIAHFQCFWCDAPASGHKQCQSVKNGQFLTDIQSCPGYNWKWGQCVCEWHANVAVCVCVCVCVCVTNDLYKIVYKWSAYYVVCTYEHIPQCVWMW